MNKENNSNILKFNTYDINAKQDSYEILEQACYAPNESQAKKLAKKALSIYPNNIDAELFLLDFENDLIKKLDALNDLINKTTKILENKNYFSKECIGKFWLIDETRPYMRLRGTKMDVLINLNRYSEAINEGEELLKLCKTDNLGIRYLLMELYCIIESYTKLERLFKKFNEKTPYVLFAKSIYYYKKGEYNSAKTIIKELRKINPFIIHMLLDYDEDSLSEYIAPKFLEDENLDYYTEEAVNVITNFIHLVQSAFYYKDFLASCYKKCY